MTEDIFINILFFAVVIIAVMSLGILGSKKEKKDIDIANQKEVLQEINYVLLSPNIITGKINQLVVSANYCGDEMRSKVQQDMCELIRKVQIAKEETVTIVEQYKV